MSSNVSSPRHAPLPRVRPPLSCPVCVLRLVVGVEVMRIMVKMREQGVDTDDATYRKAMKMFTRGKHREQVRH